MKQCKVCGETKPRSEFYAAAGMRDGLRSECNACNLARKHVWYQANRERAIARARDWQRDNRDRHLAVQKKNRRKPARQLKERDSHLRRNFGITLDQYEERLEQQGGVCAVCDAPPEEARLHVDHDHETGEVRGLLCMRCNNALGLLRESAEVVDRAADYLRSGPSAEDRDELDALITARVAALAA